MPTRAARELLACPLGLRVTFGADPAFVAEVRHAVRRIARELRAAEVAETLELIASELATNGVEASHSLSGFSALAAGVSPDLSITVNRFPGGVVVSCWDPYWQSMPVQDAAGPDDESGRGLFLVDALADAWGFEVDTGEDGTVRGKVVFAVLLFADSEPLPPASPLPVAPTVEVPRMRCNAAKASVPQPSLRRVRIQRSDGLDADLGQRVLASLGVL